MSSELPPRSENRGTLLQSLDSERLIKVAEKTTNLKAVDRLYEIVLDRLALNECLENQIAVDRISFRREVIFEIALLNADFKAPIDEAIADEEAINEALFRDFGEEQ